MSCTKINYDKFNFYPTGKMKYIISAKENVLAVTSKSADAFRLECK
jgi:hypothetical protein